MPARLSLGARMRSALGAWLNWSGAHTCVREALKAAFRLLHKLLKDDPADVRMGVLLGEGSPASASRAASCALIATLQPSALGLELSKVDDCKRMRELACRCTSAPFDYPII